MKASDTTCETGKTVVEPLILISPAFTGAANRHNPKTKEPNKTKTLFILNLHKIVEIKTG
nr:hypothetical protein [Desulfonatronospira thiodismutans]